MAYQSRSRTWGIDYAGAETFQVQQNRAKTRLFRLHVRSIFPGSVRQNGKFGLCPGIACAHGKGKTSGEEPKGDGGMTYIIPSYKTRFIKQSDSLELINLYHLARTALAGSRSGRWERM